MTGVVHRKVLTVKIRPKLLFSSSTPCSRCLLNLPPTALCCYHCKPWSCASATVQHLHQVQSPEVFIPNSAWKIHRYSTSIIIIIPFPQMPGASTPVLPTRSKLFETFLNNMYRIIIQEPDGGQSCSNKKESSHEEKHLRTAQGNNTLVWCIDIAWNAYRLGGFDSAMLCLAAFQEYQWYIELSFNQWRICMHLSSYIDLSIPETWMQDLEWSKHWSQNNWNSLKATFTCSALL